MLCQLKTVIFVNHAFSLDWKNRSDVTWCNSKHQSEYTYIPCATKPFIFVGFATKPWVFIQIMPKPWVFIANLGFEAKNIILLLICCYAVVCPHTPISLLRKRQEIVQLVVTDLVYKEFALFVKQKLGWHQKPVRAHDLHVKTLGFVTENLGLVPKTSGLLQTLCFIKPMTNPWPTRDLPMTTHEKKHGLTPPKQFRIVVFFEMFVSTTTVILQLGRTNLGNRKPGI